MYFKMQKSKLEEQKKRQSIILKKKITYIMSLFDK